MQIFFQFFLNSEEYRDSECQTIFSLVAQSPRKFDFALLPAADQHIILPPLILKKLVLSVPMGR